MASSRNTASGLLARPLTARSVLASLLLGMHPPRLSAARLVQWCELFGIAPGTARVALSRMREQGELRGNDGVYELVGRVRSRQAAQDWSVAPAVLPWDGRWRLAVVDAVARPAGERAALRDAMRRCRFAEVREGCWTRPANLPRESAPVDAWHVIDGQCSWWDATPDGLPADALAESLFAVQAWSTRARTLLRETRRVVHGLDRGGDALADGFIVGAATLQHIRNDALLPAELLPRSWPGDELRDAYRQFQSEFAAATARWFRVAREDADTDGHR
jgi:phenylacetic acid degradation operon negative regulatory protein